MTELLSNRILLAAVIAWAVAQLCKTILELFQQRKLILSRLVSSGGMPSSHTALVTSLATATGHVTGLASAPFAIAVVFAGIVMYDAPGARRALSIHARILNKIIHETSPFHPIARTH